MKRLIIVAMLLPAITSAQNAWVDQAYIQWCFSQAQPDGGLSACVGKAAGACQTAPGNDTTIGMAQCIQAETQVWDTFLNEQYQLRISELSEQSPGLSDQLRNAQRAWISFRDAECALTYSIWSGGTIRTIIAANCMLTETAERAVELRDLGKME
ncbi:lysozyme inhibitor LprI family protein [Ruegeria sp.]|uniref:lysozyme inhibitor LprI family protein n=1 Tax=Ruegeria sp. TaxID=1879320 RepID=UPI003B5910EB